MKVFISWSKDKSKEFAIKTKELLEHVTPKTKAFVSEIDINAGEKVQTKIIENINECDKLVLCFTKENKRAPWLMYEAGYASGLEKTVIPLLFDDDPNWHSWVDNPMNVAREIKFNSDDFVETFIKSFGINNTVLNKGKVEKYKDSITEIKEKFRQVHVHCEEMVEKLANNDAFLMENPLYKEKTAYFLTGFESFHLYKTIIDSFLYSGKYLWIYGRKNMKLFSGSYKELFVNLKDKASDNRLGMDGIDFRCLFLDPNSEEVERAHSRTDILKSELTSTIMRAKDEIGDRPLLKNCFRLYSNRREEIIIRLDNCIVYSRPIFDANGCPQLLTDTGFEVFSTSSDKGKECIKKFEKVWNNAKEMD